MSRKGIRFGGSSGLISSPRSAPPFSITLPTASRPPRPSTPFAPRMRCLPRCRALVALTPAVSSTALRDHVPTLPPPPTPVVSTPDRSATSLGHRRLPNRSPDPRRSPAFQPSSTCRTAPSAAAQALASCLRPPPPAVEISPAKPAPPPARTRAAPPRAHSPVQKSFRARDRSHTRPPPRLRAAETCSPRSASQDLSPHLIAELPELLLIAARSRPCRRTDQPHSGTFRAAACHAAAPASAPPYTCRPYRHPPQSSLKPSTSAYRAAGRPKSPSLPHRKLLVTLNAVLRDHRPWQPA